MSKRFSIGLISAIALLGTALVVRAANKTDEDQLRSFVSETMDAASSMRVNRTLAHADLAKVPVEFIADGEYRTFSEGDENELVNTARVALSALESEQLKLVQDAIEIKGGTAKIALRVSDESETHDVQYTMSKLGDSWVLRRVRVL